jgi:hypothetical protein
MVGFLETVLPGMMLVLDWLMPIAAMAVDLVLIGTIQVLLVVLVMEG